MAARIGEWRVGGAGARELGIHLDAVADIDDDQEGRASFSDRQRPRVLLGLAARTQHRVIEALGVRIELELLRLEHERATPIQIDASVRGAAVAVLELDGTLEHVLLFGIRVRCFHTKQGAQIDRERLRSGEFRRANAAPFRDEPIGGVCFNFTHGSGQAKMVPRD